MIEPPRVRPAIERAGCALEMIRGQVGLAEAGRAVPVALERTQNGAQSFGTEAV